MSMLTFAPSTGCPCASFTTPLTIPVDCPAAGDASDRANPAAHATSHGSRPFNRRTMESSWKNESNYRVGLVYIDPRPTRTGSVVQGLGGDESLALQSARRLDAGGHAFGSDGKERFDAGQ